METKGLVMLLAVVLFALTSLQINLNSANGALKAVSYCSCPLCLFIAIAVIMFDFYLFCEAFIALL